MLRIAAIVCCLAVGPVARADSPEPTHAGKPLSHWLQLLESNESGKQRQALTALRAMGPKAVSALPTLEKVPAIVVLLRERWLDRSAAAQLLRADVVAVCPGLIAALDSDDTDRISATLAQFRAAALPHLANAAADRSPRVRAGAATAICQMG